VVAQSSSGGVTFDATTGAVISNSTEYPILVFDVLEWRTWYANESLADVREIDILDIGYWLRDGSYTPPEFDWRREIVNQK
jgi:hypothetical protein